MTITLDIPDKILSPNARPHWAAKMRVVSSTRYAAHARAAYARRDAGNPSPLLTAKVTLRYFFRTKARRDRDNLLARAKACIDGLTDAGLWVDDSACTYAPVEVAIDRTNPRLEIEVQEA